MATMPSLPPVQGKAEAVLRHRRVFTLANNGPFDDLKKTSFAWPCFAENCFGVVANQYNEATFGPVKTTELKMEIQFQPGRCGSLIRWRVE